MPNGAGNAAEQSEIPGNPDQRDTGLAVQGLRGVDRFFRSGLIVKIGPTFFRQSCRFIRSQPLGACRYWKKQKAYYNPPQRTLILRDGTPVPPKHDGQAKTLTPLSFAVQNPGPRMGSNLYC